MQRRTLVTLGLLILTTTFLYADGREWTKIHEKVATSEGVEANFSSIYTSDDEMPFLGRDLLKLGDGSLLIVRREFQQGGAWAYSIESLATGELLRFEHKGTLPTSVIVEFGSEHVVLFEDELKATGSKALPLEYQAACAALTAGASQQFREELRAFAEMGIHDSAHFFSTAGWTALTVFPEMQFSFNSIDDITEVIDSVCSFDPHTKPPTRFEAQFGNAYFE